MKRRRSPTFADLLTCVCGATVIKRGAGQKYCISCSDAADTRRKQKWKKDHPQKQDPVVTRARARKFEAKCTAAGLATSKLFNSPITVNMAEPVDPAWMVRVAVPFTYSASKNAVYSLANEGGHVFKRALSNQFRAALTLAVRAAISNSGAKVFENKLWIDIFVQKSNHRGDAVNVVDVVCDALKDACGVDDRWFSIRRLDWEICKSEPRIFVGIMQEDCFHARCCSSCGRTLPVDQFTKNAKDRLGVGRTCHDCRTATVPDLLTRDAA